MIEKNSSEISDFRLPALRLDRSQLQVWVDNGWTKPGSPDAISNILLQFYTSEAANAYSNMQLMAYPRKANGFVYVDGKTILSIDTSVEGFLLSGPAVLANNQISMASLDILNEDGTLNSFEYILFTPERYPKDPEYVNYAVEVVRTEQRAGAVEMETNPCPPYCPDLE